MKNQEKHAYLTIINTKLIAKKICVNYDNSVSVESCQLQILSLVERVIRGLVLVTRRTSRCYGFAMP